MAGDSFPRRDVLLTAPAAAFVLTGRARALEGTRTDGAAGRAAGSADSARPDRSTEIADTAATSAGDSYGTTYGSQPYGGPAE